METVQLFLRLQTQWQYHGVTGHRTGLLYSSIAPTCAAIEMEMTPQLFSDIQLMEITAINEAIEHGTRHRKL